MRRLLEKISPFRVMDILKEARSLPGAVHMEVGEPDLPPSEKVREALLRAVSDHKFYYTPAKGLVELREKISDYYNKRYSVKVSPERIIITPGTSGAFLVVFALVTDEQRGLVLSDPSYPCYKNFSYFLQTRPLFIPVDSSSNYQITPEMLEDIKGAGAVMVSSPSNPTGTVYDPPVFERLIEVAEKKGIWFISDEIYHGLEYEDRVRSALEFSDRAIVINGFSKYFCMPGFRVGWMILPEELVRKAEIIVQNIFIAANTPAQYAATEAFDEDYLSTVRETFRQRRDFLYSRLKELFRIDAIPEGAFYIWVDISDYSDNSVEFCRRLLKQKAVAITPGVDFGENNTIRYVRFAYTRNMDELEEGVKRIKEFLREG
jgi:aspartate/methionine/tyrosine aminotransferase